MTNISLKVLTYELTNLPRIGTRSEALPGLHVNLVITYEAICPCGWTAKGTRGHVSKHISNHHEAMTVISPPEIKATPAKTERMHLKHLALMEGDKHPTISLTEVHSFWASWCTVCGWTNRDIGSAINISLEDDMPPAIVCAIAERLHGPTHLGKR